MDTCKMDMRNLCSLWILVMILGPLCVITKDNQPQVKGGEYCQFDTFEASCGPEEVVQIEGANYGRMRLGKCVLSDLGFVGCKADVLDLVDERCSGKRKCSIRMPDEEIASRRPCMTELKMYLEANYTCRKVIGIESRSQCASCDWVKVTQPSGLIASSITRETGCGAAKCPWLLEASPGQIMDITLINYGWNKADDSCQVKAIIKEVGQKNAPLTVCASKKRTRHIYTSLSHAVELRMVTGKPKPQQSEFLIKYKFLGCQELAPPHGGWARRVDGVTTMGCNSTSDTWSMTCDGSEWIGERQECPGYGAEASGSLQGGRVRLPSGLSIVIIIAVAFVVGAFILCIGVIMFRKRYLPRAPPPGGMYPDSKSVTSPDVVKDPLYMPPLYNQQSRDPASVYQERPYRTERENYTPIWERPLPNPGTESTACSCPTGSSTSPGHHVSHESEYNTLASVTDTIPAQPINKRGMVYGNNTMARKEYELPSPDSDNDPRYFQVDPE